MIVEDEIKKGEMLNEGIFDILKKIGKKVTNFFKRFWNKVKRVVSKSFEALIRFMGLEVEVGFNNQIKW